MELRYTWTMAKFLIIRTVFSLLAAIVILDTVIWAGNHQSSNVPDYPSIGTVAKPAPTFADVSAKFPNCRDASKVKRFADEVLVSSPDHSRVYRESFDAAWKINHDADQSNNVWVLGKCF